MQSIEHPLSLIKWLIPIVFVCYLIYAGLDDQSPFFSKERLKNTFSGVKAYILYLIIALIVFLWIQAIISSPPME